MLAGKTKENPEKPRDKPRDNSRDKPKKPDN